MKRLFVLLFITVISASISYAQNPNLTVSGDVVEMTTDLDARAYFPKRDINDKLCALIKVTLTNTLRNPLTLEVGGLGVVAREEKNNGEIWFYVPAQVRNLSFKCAGYISPAPIPVVFKEGVVYGITLSPGAMVETVTNAVLSTNYLKLKVNVADAIISLGRTKDYELFTQNIGDGEFAEYLDYGTYYYKVEHPLYEVHVGVIELNGSTPKREVTLVPAYGYLDVNSTPEGATIYMDGIKVGVTPYSIEEPLPRGLKELRLELNDYHTFTANVNIAGDGSRHSINPTLRPRFADVTLVCTDGEAEIWIDSQFKGVGSWTGRLRSTSKHLVETRRAGHRSQSTHISLTDGETVTHTLKAPVPLYGGINIMTTPMGCTIKIDGKVVGESPYIGQLLVGTYEVELSKVGYQTVTTSAEVAHNQVVSVNETLERGGVQAEVIVSCVDKGANIFINDEKVAEGEWHGKLYEGEYLFEARKIGCEPSIQREIISGSRRVVVSLPVPKRSYGSLTVEGTERSKVAIRSIDMGGTADYDIGRLNDFRLPVGEYDAYAYRDGYYDSPKQKFSVVANQNTKLTFNLKPMEVSESRVEETPARSNEEAAPKPAEPAKQVAPANSEKPNSPQKATKPNVATTPSKSYTPSQSRFLTELTYDGAYMGASVGMFFGDHFGAYGSYAMGFSEIGSEFSIGPMLRIGNFEKLELHLFAGAGFNSYEGDFKCDFGVRVGYDLLKGVNGKTAFSCGGTLIGGRFYPKFGVAILWGRGK